MNFTSESAQARLTSLLQGKNSLHELEGEILCAALMATEGNSTRAAKLLGLKSPQSIVVLLNKHPEIRAQFPARARI